MYAPCADALTVQCYTSHCYVPMGSNCDLKVFLTGQGSLKNKLAGWAVSYLSVVQSIFPSLSKLFL